MRFKLITSVVGSPLLCLLNAANAADFALLDFDLDHGTVITNQYSSDGITISATGAQNTAIVYDSELGAPNGLDIDGSDVDLEREVQASGASPGGVEGDLNRFGWDGGNLGANYNAGGLLIIQENGPEATNPTYGSGANTVTSASLYDPDDDGGGGTITFDIDSANFTYNYFQVTLGDFEEEGSAYEVTLNGVDGTVRTFTFNTFTQPFLTAGGDPTDVNTGNPNPDYDPSITSGNNHINILPEVSIFNDPGIEAFDSVDISFDGVSGSVSSIIFSETPIPEPSSALLLSFGGLLLLRRRR